MTLVVRASVLHGVEDFCLQYGIDYQKLLNSAGLAANIDPFAEQYIPLVNAYDLLAKLKQASHCEHIALQLAKAHNLNILGALGQLMLTADTLGQAWKCAMHYQSLHSTHFLWTMTPYSPYIQMEFKPLFKFQHSIRESVELSIANMYCFFRQITSKKWKPQAIFFSHPAPKEIKPYKDFFQTPLHFNAEFDGMWITPKDLEINLPGANPHLHTTLCHYADTQIKSAGEDHTLQLAKGYIKHNLPAGKHQLNLIANSLGMSSRTLQRKLQQLGYQYEALVAEVRFELSYFYLANNALPITLIADYVGYKNVSTFSTAFKKHTGKTPREWRQKQGN